MNIYHIKREGEIAVTFGPQLIVQLPFVDSEKQILLTMGFKLTKQNKP